MPMADINGIRMNYSVTGEGEPVVLITGFGGDTTFFHSLIPTLVDNYKVIVFDNRGAGLTQYKGPFKGQDFVDDVVALLDHLSIFRAHILGWSMGAHIAQEFTIQNPDRVLTLTLVSAYMRRPARSSYFMNNAVNMAIRDKDPSIIAMMINSFCFTEDYFAGKEAKGSKIRITDNIKPENLKHQMYALDDFDTRGKMDLIKVPTLSIHGLDDIMVEPKMGDAIAAGIKNCKVFRIPNIGHTIHPSLYAEAFKNHLINSKQR